MVGSGIILSDDERSLRYEAQERARGFDFTNLTCDEDHLSIDSEPGRIEREMIEALFVVFDHLDDYPLRLISLEDEWISSALIGSDRSDEDLIDALERIESAGAHRAVIEIDRPERKLAAALIWAQLIYNGASSVLIGASRAALASVSREEEVRFDIRSPDFYARALRRARELAKGHRFEIICVDSDQLD